MLHLRFACSILGHTQESLEDCDSGTPSVSQDNIYMNFFDHLKMQNSIETKITHIYMKDHIFYLKADIKNIKLNCIFHMTKSIGIFFISGLLV